MTLDEQLRNLVREEVQRVAPAPDGKDWPALMKPKTAAAYLNMSESHLHALANAGRLPCRTLDGRRHFVRAELDEWMRGLPIASRTA